MLGLRTTLLVVLAMLTMTLDHHYHSLNRLRYWLHGATDVLPMVVDKPMDWVDAHADHLRSRAALIKENKQLQSNKLILSSRLQQFEALLKENTMLRSLLHETQDRPDQHVKMARLLAVDLSPGTQQVILDKGARDGLHTGQSILDAHGLMGQIIEVNPTTSRVLLLTDQLSAVPIQNNRNGQRAIVVGLGYDQKLTIPHVIDDTEFSVGDLLVTSGLGQRFVPGYPVGRVTNVTHDTNERFVTIHVKPVAAMNRSRHVLVLMNSVKKQGETNHG